LLDIAVFFKTDNLAHVSPSSISSIGLIHIANEDCWLSILAAWLQRCSYSEPLKSLCEGYVVPAMDYIHGRADRLGFVSRVKSAATPPKPKRLSFQSNENIIGTLVALVEVGSYSCPIFLLNS
jgi:hypothetical protein